MGLFTDHIGGQKARYRIRPLPDRKWELWDERQDARARATPYNSYTEALLDRIALEQGIARRFNMVTRGWT